MAVDVYESSIVLRIGLLEAHPIRSTSEPGYPYPQLAATAAVEERTFPALVIENPYLRATIVPSLGGRVLQVFDKRAARDLLPAQEILESTAGGPRGASLPDGIQLTLDGQERLNALGPVAFQIEEGDHPGIWLSESAMSVGLSWHLRISMPPDAAHISLEARILNRTFQEQPYNGGFSGVPAHWVLDAPRNAFNGTLRFPTVSALQGRQVDHWSATLSPYPENPTASSSQAAIWLKDDLTLQVAAAQVGCKLFLLTPDSDTLEAAVDLYPESPSVIPIGGHAPVALVLQAADGSELLRWTHPSGSLSLELPKPLHLPFDPFAAGTRHLAHTFYGIEALGASRFQEADDEFEQALLYNGDDPLLWWAKAVAKRHLGELGDSDELENAHYLAPLEPALRAEAFLNQAPVIGSSPLVSNLLPEELIEVACLLLEHRLMEDASRWIDEALRHHDLTMLHYLYADALLERTKMVAEAAQHVSLAAKATLGPYPWRPIEWDAIKRLLGRFPSDQQLTELHAL